MSLLFSSSQDGALARKNGNGGKPLAKTVLDLADRGIKHRSSSPEAKMLTSNLTWWYKIFPTFSASKTDNLHSVLTLWCEKDTSGQIHKEGKSSL